MVSKMSAVKDVCFIKEGMPLIKIYFIFELKLDIYNIFKFHIVM